MPTTGVINGTNLRLFVNNGTGTPIAIGYATTCTIDLSAEERDTLSKDSVASWREFEIGQLSGTCSTEGLMTFDSSVNGNSRREFSDLFTIFSAKTEITCWFTTNASGDDRYYFNGFITALSSSAAVEENATYSVTIGINGQVLRQSIT